jgi:hypothetical protein
LAHVTVDSLHVLDTVATLTGLVPAASPLSLIKIRAAVTVSPAASPVTVNVSRHCFRSPTSSLTKQFVRSAAPWATAGVDSATYASADAVKVRSGNGAASAWPRTATSVPARAVANNGARIRRTENRLNAFPSELAWGSVGIGRTEVQRGQEHVAESTGEASMARK